MRIHESVAAMIAATMTIGAARAAPIEALDLNSLSHGDVAAEQFAVQGVHISGFNDSPDGEPDLAVIFDSRARNTADTDLEGPNGIDGSWAGGNLPTNTILGNLIIIQENGDDADADNGTILDDGVAPDDEGSRPAGRIKFTFDFEIDKFRLTLIDIEGPDEFNADGFAISFHRGAALLGQIPFSEFVTDGAVFGDNTANEIDTIDIRGRFGQRADMITVHLGGSGGITGVKYVVPAPVALPAGLVLLGMVATMRRKRMV